MENEILDFLNERIREEHGTRVTLDSTWMDAQVDSFGTVMIFADLDNEYGCFDREYLSTVKFYDGIDEEGNAFSCITIREVVERIINANRN